MHFSTISAIMMMALICPLLASPLPSEQAEQKQKSSPLRFLRRLRKGSSSMSPEYSQAAYTQEDNIEVIEPSVTYGTRTSEIPCYETFNYDITRWLSDEELANNFQLQKEGLIYYLGQPAFDEAVNTYAGYVYDGNVQRATQDIVHHARRWHLTRLLDCEEEDKKKTALLLHQSACQQDVKPKGLRYKDLYL